MLMHLLVPEFSFAEVLGALQFGQVRTDEILVNFP